MALKPTVRIVLYKKHKLNNNRHPIKIMVYYHNEKKYYSVKTLNLSNTIFTEKEYNSIINYKGSKNVELVNNRNLILRKQQDTQELANSIIPFNFELFKAKLYDYDKLNTLKSARNNIFTGFEEYYDSLIKEERISYANSLYNTLNHLKKFWKSKELPYQLITVDFLKSFEKYLYNNNVKSIATIGIYMRNIRRIINIELDRKNSIISTDNYPFGKNKYNIRTVSKESVKALNKEQIELIKNYNTDKKNNRLLARDMWLFSYYGNGMNMSDILRLKYENLVEDDGKLYIKFKREKIKRTNRTITEIKFKLNKIQEEIINKYGNENIKENYIFPKLNDDMDEKTCLNKISDMNKLVSKNMVKIVKELDLKIKISAIYARHSFTSVLINEDIAVNTVSKMLGHKNLTTTQHYIAKVSNEKLDKVSELL